MSARGCEFFAHGGNHDLWRGPKGLRVTVPRHKEISRATVRSICARLAIEVPRER